MESRDGLETKPTGGYVPPDVTIILDPCSQMEKHKWFVATHPRWKDIIKKWQEQRHDDRRT